MDPAKVKAIVNWSRPADGKAMQCFMGAANFHWDFLYEFAKIAAPLNDCHLENIINWTPA